MSKDIKRLPDGTFAPGTSGNPAGRPLGARNKATIAAIEIAMSDKSDELTDRLVRYAWLGYPEAMRIYFNRLAPPRKGRPVQFPLPKLETLDDAEAYASAITQGVTDGALTPPEATELFRVLDAFERRHAKSSLAERLAELERLVSKDGQQGSTRGNRDDDEQQG
jgi:hypothetical protein